MEEKLKQIIKNEWDITYDTFDQGLQLMALAEEIACTSENCTVAEAYAMYIEIPALHLPGIIAFCMVDELGVDYKKVNAHTTLREIFSM